ncbi:MAG: hypothetical protein HOE90_09640 [Bacteriovoracaceae bacterium]|nr:hypothetical protein [Bacteriovoracaceae bacterium]
MKKKANILSLTEIEVEKIKDFGELNHYSKEEMLIYKGHVPKVSFVFLDGKMELQRNYESLLVENFCIVGLHELVEELPFKYSLKIFPGSKCIVLNKSSLVEIKNIQGGLGSVLANFPLV